MTKHKLTVGAGVALACAAILAVAAMIVIAGGDGDNPSIWGACMACGAYVFVVAAAGCLALRIGGPVSVPRYKATAERK